ncbi:hypothetical protein [Gordonia humi]|uniref:Uncharacterized protein n=1 Tax=Gordonia humi TaxID=686429 RepID=A0A840EX59_9ACTN|nr:hypothetical protein [Gordonia humi]MBB4134928.1 hypothetical protein [Gordonia humi]
MAVFDALAEPSDESSLEQAVMVAAAAMAKVIAVIFIPVVFVILIGRSPSSWISGRAPGDLLL